MQEAKNIAGYDYGTMRAAKSPLRMDDLRKLEQAVGWTDEDAKWLRVAAEVLVPKADELVSAWRSEIVKLPQLLESFQKPDGQPDDHYREAVKKRFVQWVSDLCLRPHDQDWLNYQEEIGLRHTPAKKNKTDNAQTPPVVPLRYTLGFSAVVLTTLRGFLTSSGRREQDIQRIQDAWTRAVILTVTLWSRPYTAPGLW
jgi:hypothetical protein